MSKTKTCSLDFGTENGNIKRLENDENYAKIGYCKSFPHATNTPHSSYIPDNSELTIFHFLK
jgi:hypothetical protein